jgi:putative PIN family toxin of toxin-antitoxin system
MRVLLDTNVLLSALWFPGSRLASTVLGVVERHEIVLCDRNIFELRDVIRRKAPETLADAEIFLSSLRCEIIPELHGGGIGMAMRDPKDQPILNAAAVADVDVIITGDKDFLCLELDCPRIMSVAQFREWEGLD